MLTCKLPGTNAYNNCVPTTFFNIWTLFDARESFLVLSAMGHAGAPFVHHDVRLGPEKAPWCVLWAFKVTNYDKSRGCFHGVKPRARPSKTHMPAVMLHCCKGEQHGNNNRFKLSSILQLRTLPCVWTTTTMLVLGYVLCPCVTHAINRTRLCVRKDTYLK